MILALGIFIWMVSLYFDLCDHLHKTLVAYENYESDELLMGIVTIGLMGLAFSIRRLQELKGEVALRNRAEINAEWLAVHDPLTGLFNRRFLDRKLEELNHAKSVKSLAGYAIDLNGSKKVNDLAGHEAGDMVLVDVTRKLKEIFPDDNVVRLGGDQFLVVANGSSARERKRQAAEIVASICEPSVISNIHLQVGVSVGIALYPQHVRSLSDFLHSADIAMYMAKRNGHNGIYVFDASMENELVRKAETEMAVRSAIKSNIIEPHYQPLIKLATNEIEGFEALARWTEGADNALPPSVFIGVAENIGLIVELLDRLLRRACLDAMQWPDSITLSYNISPMQLADPFLGLRIIWVLSETKLPPHRLQIEITEASLVNNLESAGKIIADLRRIGIKIVLDDFGTGYSSLSQLSKLNFDKTKN